MAGKDTTLFIEDTSIRLLTTKGKQVVSWASAPLEPGLVSGGVILDEAQVADKVKELFRQAKVSTNKVIAGLSGLNSLYRLITLPELPEAILFEAVRREAGRVIPVSLDEVYLSYQRIPTQRIPTPSGETHVFLAAFPRNGTDALIRTLRRAGLEPYILDLSPLALCRVLSEPRAIIVSARLGYLDLIVMVQRVPQVIRSLSLPGEAESLSEKIAAIAEELDRTVAFYNSSHAEEPLDSSVPLFVCGDLAEAPDTWQSLVGKLNCPVSVLPSPLEYPESFPVNEFMVNIGLALKKLPPEKEGAYFSLVNFNTLPEIYLPERPSLTRILVSIGIIVGVGALVFAGFLVWSAAADTAALRSQMALAESYTASHIEKIATLRGQMTQVESQIKPLQATDDTLRTKLTSLQEERERFSADLNTVDMALPENVLLLKVEHSGDLITISGATWKEHEEGQQVEQELRTNIFNYAKSLRSSEKFSEVIVSSLKYEPQYIDVTEEVEEDGETVEKVKEVKIERFEFVFLLK